MGQRRKIRERARGAVVAVNLVDMAYQIRANAGPAALASMRAGWFMTARIVPETDFHAADAA